MQTGAVGDPPPSWTSTVPPALPLSTFAISERAAHRGAVRRCIGLLTGIAGRWCHGSRGWDTKIIPRVLHICGGPGVVLTILEFLVPSSVVIVGGNGRPACTEVIRGTPFFLLRWSV